MIQLMDPLNYKHYVNYLHFYCAFLCSNDTICQQEYNYDQYCKRHNTTLYLACTSIFVVLRPPSSLLKLNTFLVFQDLS